MGETASSCANACVEVNESNFTARTGCEMFGTETCRAGYSICTGYSDYNETQAELKHQRELAEYQRQQRLEALANKTAKELALKEKMKQERKEAEEKRLREAAAKKRKEDGTKLEEERLKQVDEFERDKRWAEQRREAIANATTRHSAIVSK